MKKILVVDSDPILLHTVAGLLRGQGGFLNISSATNVQVTLEILASETIHVLIAGQHLNEMDTFELASLVVGKYPDIRIIVMTNNASSMFRTKIKQMPTVIHFDQPLDIGLLTKRIFTELQIDYGGQLRGVSLAAFLQMLEFDRLSCTLRVATKGKVGTVFVQNGNPIAAKMGFLTGDSAIQHILSWQNVWIDIDYAPFKMEREINTPLMNLILESGRIVDEKHSQGSDLRKHNRFDCLVGVDFEIADWTYQCCLRDISQGGAYVETEQPIRVAQKLTIFLSSPILSKTLAINGRVVRRDPNGVGVRFDTLTPDQKKVIQVLMESRCKAIAPPN